MNGCVMLFTSTGGLPKGREEGWKAKGTTAWRVRAVNFSILVENAELDAPDPLEPCPPCLPTLFPSLGPHSARKTWGGT